MSINRNAVAVYEAKLVVGVIDAIRCDVRGSGKQATKERCLCVDGWTERWDEGSLSARESMAMRPNIVAVESRTRGYPCHGFRIATLSGTRTRERRWAEVSDKGKSRVGRGGSPYNTGTHGAETGSPELLVAGGGSRLRGPWAQRPERDVERRSWRKQSATQIKPRPPEADAKKKKKARKSRVVPAGFTADVQLQPRSSFPPKKKETRERRNIDKPQPQVVPLGDNRPRESDVLAHVGLGEKRVRTRGEWRARILQRGCRGRGRYSSVRKPNKELYILYFRVDLEPDGLTSERYPPAVGRAKDQFPNTEIVD
ncbi:hypothetical protein H4582DRAFT_2066319 [Lactarius indigo]|nr:hypothetical protein H4582DRAFT_2066319 [Lactarius indigo]